ncbi:hypothetical protein RQP46_009701 [Phenoliferia psychrophenolica]
MATIGSLANETLTQIMEMLKGDTLLTWRDTTSPSPGRYDSLRAAALVCSRWKDPAQRALFDDVELEYRYTRRYRRFLASPAQSRYRTRSLRVLGYGWDVALEVANVCEGLRTLHLFCAGVIEWTDLARPCFAAGLSSLDLYTAHTFNQYPAFAAILSASKYTLKLLRLQIYRTDASMPLLCPTLRESEVGPTLECLILEASFEALQGYIDIFPVFETLKSFSWYCYDAVPQLRANDVKNLRTILDAFPFPATLTHLSIGTDDFSSLEHILLLLEHPILALLTKLDFPSFPDFTPSLQVLAAVALMAKACEDRGIQWSMGGALQ